MKAALFDFDGVIVDTEPIYDIFWNEAGIRYNTGIPNFADVIKGTTMPDVIKKYFSDRTPEYQQMVLKESAAYESTMPLPPLAGSVQFLRTLKSKGVKIALVTSSDNSKVNRGLRELDLEGLFDTIVTADRITSGKPDPMCYLLAAKDLEEDPENCLVFEDSFAGIQSGNDAGMRVIGLSTTNAPETIQDKVFEVIPDFQEITFEKYLSW
ncbi:MAG: HAD family phosphatase [Tannerellaceae bacterium]|nr:HAD family phosphatase [Tannerellaceae bacterium]